MRFLARLTNIRRSIAPALTVVLLVGCSLAPTTGSRTDAEAAQNFLPNIAGYSTTDAGDVASALSKVTGGASLLTGNPLLAALVTKIDGMVTCYQNVGAVSARIYTQTSIDLANPQIPGLGAVAVINQERLRENFLACALSTGFGAQAASVEPCFGTGDFKVNNQSYTYLYGGSTPALCGAFQTHFDALKASGQ